MRQVISILLTVGLFAAGLPHQACGCGCVAVSETEVAGKPSCCQEPREPISDQHLPCRCEHCPTFDGVFIEQPVVLGASTRFASHDRLPADVALNDEVICPRTDAPSPEPDRWLGSTDRSITILLGHLLL